MSISDPENRMLNDFSALWKVTYKIWRVGLAGDQQREIVVKHLVDCFNGCLYEKITR
ncbi:hypothetical protein CHCC14821_3467 [Bacillus paralicheniformis]|nr:hypothetical protein CHCC14821_3467 [Bacillus paralicheniformis]